MKYLVTDDTGLWLPKGKEMVLTAEEFEKIVHKHHKYDLLHILDMKDGMMEVWIHYPETEYTLWT